MEESILTSTKKVLGLDAEYTVFDLDVITHINSVFSILNQLGIGPDEGFFIEDEGPEWSDLGVPQNWITMIRTYVFLRVRLLFDPPTTSFLIEAMNSQIAEYEQRLNYFREATIPLVVEEEVDVG